MIILSIDPGTHKCGIAILSQNHCIKHTIVKREGVINIIDCYIRDYNIDSIVIGNGTGSKSIISDLKKYIDIPLHQVNESFSTLEARQLYFRDNPPRGWRRFIPQSLLIPDRDYDDYVAIVIGRRFIGA